jgi:iron(III) transport system substrate-binding protein
MRILKRVVAVSLCLAIAVAMGGCGHKKSAHAAGSNVSADPSVRGDVTVYTSLAESQSSKYLVSFRKQYPNVNLTLVSDNPTVLMAKVIKQKKTPVADVIWHTPLSAVTAAEEASALASYSYHPGQYDAVAADYSDGDHPATPLFVGTDAKLIGWAVNTSKTGGAAPQAFADLTDSKYAGQIVAPSINTDAGYTMVASLLSADGDGNDEAWAYLDQLDKNVAYYTDDEAAPAQAVADGSAGVGIGFDKQVTDVANSGGSAQAVFPGLPEMSPYEIDVDALVNKPSPSSAAKTFLDWAISDDAMNAYAAETPITSVDQGNGLPQGYPATVSDQLMQNEDFSYSADNHDKIVAEWKKRYGKKIKAQ